jgi:hypothetical protein
MLKNVSEHKKEDAENFAMRSFIICILHQIILGESNQGGTDM